MTSLYIIAGESSGDLIGARFLQALPNEIEMHGIGGPLMESAGLSSLFPMQEIALMGFAEVLPHIFRLKRRIKETVLDILKKQPDVVVTIDSPVFTFRVAKQLRESGYTGKLVHYVAPSVWAYKPERAAKTAALFDMLLVIFPFEPPYFTKHGLATEYVGHPIPWEWRDAANQPAFNKTEGSFLLGMLAGSRKGEVNRHLPIFKNTVELLLEEIPNLEVMLPVRPHLAEHVRSSIADWPVKTHIIEGDDNKQSAFKACDMILAKSGTVSVECAMAGVPTITTYRANPISAWMVKRMIQIPFVNLINITANQPIIPELLQEECTAKNLAAAILSLHSDEAAQQQQLKASAEVLEKLGSQTNPAQKAVDAVLSCLAV